MARYGIVPLGFVAPKYLLIYEDRLSLTDSLTEEMLEALAAEELRVVDLEINQEILADLSAVVIDVEN